MSAHRASIALAWLLFTEGAQLGRGRRLPRQNAKSVAQVSQDKVALPRASSWATAVVLFTFAALPALSFAESKDHPPEVRTVTISDGIELHYVEKGEGIPVVFVHGALSDLSYWNDEVAAFARSGYRAIAYSRRYNPPNTNPARPAYSAVVDAADLAGLIEKLRLGKVHIIGHSYGGLTALFLAVKHPDLVRTLVLAEAAAVSLLEHPSGDRSEIAKATFADIQERMVKPMKAGFQKGDREAGLRAFISYVDGPLAWDKMPDAARQDVFAHAHEWDVMMTTGELFPELNPAPVRKIQIPALLLSGGKSYPFLNLVDEQLKLLLPRSQRVILPEATHEMWIDQPETCRKAVLAFWQKSEHRRPAPTS
jgi:pimeloyl-ACP methyl ester carboxylesterase